MLLAIATMLMAMTLVACAGSEDVATSRVQPIGSVVPTFTPGSWKAELMAELTATSVPDSTSPPLAATASLAVVPTVAADSSLSPGLPGATASAPRAVTPAPTATIASAPTPAPIAVSALCNAGQSTAATCSAAGSSGIAATLGIQIWATVADWNATTLWLDSGPPLSWSQFQSAFALLPLGQHSLVIRERRSDGIATSSPFAFKVIAAAPPPPVAAAVPAAPKAWDLSSQATANAGGDCWARATAAGYNAIFRSWLCVEDDYETVTVVRHEMTTAGYGLVIRRASGGRYRLELASASCPIAVNTSVVMYSPNGFGNNATIPQYGCRIRNATNYFG